MSRSQTRFGLWAGAFLGVLLLAGSAAGVAHAVSGTVAAGQYFMAVCARPPPAPETVLALCAKAYGWAPWNYYFSIAAAELAYRQSETATTNAAAWRRLSSLWCDRGLAQNPHKSQLVRLKTRLLWPDSPAQAIACWSEYTDWNFWEPYNHAVLAEMRALATRSQGGVSELPDGTGSFGDLLKQSVDAVDRQRQESSALQRSFELGETQDLATVMIANQKANLSFQAMVTVRNRLVEAYKDVMNMPI